MTQDYRVNSNPLGYKNQRAILIYDLSIENIEERKNSVIKFDTVQDCAEHYRTGRNNIMRAIGKRWTDPRTLKQYAIRDCGTTEGAPGFGLISAKEAARQDEEGGVKKGKKK